MKNTKEKHDMKLEDFNNTNQKLLKSIQEMLANINDLRKLERIHRFIEYVYTIK